MFAALVVELCGLFRLLLLLLLLFVRSRGVDAIVDDDCGSDSGRGRDGVGIGIWASDVADVNRSSGLLFVALLGRNVGTEDILRPSINK